jgi:pimeloyl-ACP methyl ester carboxylesterase
MIPFKLRLLAMLATPFLLLHPGTGHAAAVPAAAAAPVLLDHISIEAVGKGPPVFLIPGLASPRAVWDGVVPALARTHRVYLVQVNGFGGDAPGGNLKPGILSGIVADLDAYIARNRIGPAIVVGHSMGGLAGLMLARAHPGDVARLMIVDSLPFFAVLMAPQGTSVAVADVEPTARMMRDKIAATYGKPADPAAAEANVNGLALKPESRARMRAWSLAADPRVTAEALYEDLTTDLRPDLPAIRTPVTLIYPWNAGGPTRDMADAFYRRQYAALPNIAYADIGDSAHFVMLDQPAPFEAALEKFVAGR